MITLEGCRSAVPGQRLRLRPAAEAPAEDVSRPISRPASSPPPSRSALGHSSSRSLRLATRDAPWPTPTTTGRAGARHLHPQSCQRRYHAVPAAEDRRGRCRPVPVTFYDDAKGQTNFKRSPTIPSRSSSSAITSIQRLARRSSRMSSCARRSSTPSIGRDRPEDPRGP